jgi:Helix-turn-helix of DDE superfamily endonuclease
MYPTTGLTKDEITELCALIEEHGLVQGMRSWPPILGLRNAVTVTLTYLRRNRVQAEIAKDYGVSQPTISRAISAITPLLVTVLADFVPTADDLDTGWYYVVDGTLLPCWTWRAHPELKSGKHRASGLKMLLACAVNGRLAWISDPVNGSRHDMYCLKES